MVANSLQNSSGQGFRFLPFLLGVIALGLAGLASAQTANSKPDPAAADGVRVNGGSNTDVSGFNLAVYIPQDRSGLVLVAQRHHRRRRVVHHYRRRHHHSKALIKIKL